MDGAMPRTLVELLAPIRLTEVVDIGANPIDGEPPYRAMLSEGLCRVTGFEPQAQALAGLVQKKSPNERYLPYAVGDGGAHTLKVCAAPGMTSLLEPDPRALEVFERLKAFAVVIDRVPVETRRLDDISEISHLDFLKIDIQGGELDVFKAGRQKLSEAVAIQTEVSFMTLYKDQPTQAEVDQELRSQGFIPHCFAELEPCVIAPCVVNNNSAVGLRQLLEADMVYVRDFLNPEKMTDEQLKHLALIAHHCYGSFDLALRCVMLLVQRRAVSSSAMDDYVQIVAAKQAAS
jgi:FkbM family methyltransferase